MSLKAAGAGRSGRGGSIGPLDPLCHELKQAHQTNERTFDSWRDRYAVAGTSHATGSKRTNSRAAQLRVAAALLVDCSRSVCATAGTANARAGTAGSPSSARAVTYHAGNPASALGDFVRSGASPRSVAAETCGETFEAAPRRLRWLLTVRKPRFLEQRLVTVPNG
ncbi:MAG: hypothetical protein ACRDL0_10435 [Thermoleophilaceae bacterium]